MEQVLKEKVQEQVVEEEAVKIQLFLFNFKNDNQSQK